MINMDWKKYAFVIAGQNRVKIILSLLDYPKTPTQISGETQIHISHVSRGLGELVEQQLVECITPERKRGRIYQLTKIGKEIGFFLKREKQEL